MSRIVHWTINVDSRMTKMPLLDYAIDELNYKLESYPNARVINIQEKHWTSEVRPKPNSSNTWQDVDYCTLTVFLQLE